MQQYANTIFLVSGPAKATKEVRELLPQHGFVENSIKGIFSGKTGPNNNEELLLAISILLGEGGKVLPWLS